MSNFKFDVTLILESSKKYVQRIKSASNDAQVLNKVTN
jgi:hypothetical protein